MSHTPATLAAQLAVVQAAVLAVCATLPPERATMARRMFAAALANLEDGPRRSPEADAAAAGVAAAVLATLGAVPS